MYGEIKVTTTKSRGFADYVTRTFLVEKVLTAVLVYMVILAAAAAFQLVLN